MQRWEQQTYLLADSADYFCNRMPRLNSGFVYIGLTRILHKKQQ